MLIWSVKKSHKLKIMDVFTIIVTLGCIPCSGQFVSGPLYNFSHIISGAKPISQPSVLFWTFLKEFTHGSPATHRNVFMYMWSVCHPFFFMWFSYGLLHYIHTGLTYGKNFFNPIILTSYHKLIQHLSCPSYLIFLKSSQWLTFY